MKKVLILSLLMLGCASLPKDEQGYQWVQDGPVGIPIIHRDVDVYLSCGFNNALSCAIQRGDGDCHVYLPPNPAPWMESHELRHCAGWRHPGANLEF